MKWYRLVSADITKLSAALTYYETELTEAEKECKLTGNIDKAAARLPGNVQHRFNQLQDLDSILEMLNIELNRIKSDHYKKYTERYHRELKSTTIDKYILGESDVVTYNKLIMDVADIRNQYLGIMKGLDTAQWQIGNITKLRCAGLDDAYIT